MIPILDTKQVREGDKYTVENEPISSIDLMERAARYCSKLIIDNETFTDKKFYIVCGSGNNGGDGVAMARILYASRRIVEVFLPENHDNFSNDLTENINSLPKDIKVGTHSDFLNTDIPDDAIIIDALLGSGLSRPIGDGTIADVICKINSLDNIVISIDIPSGLFADKPMDYKNAHIVKADYTFTIAFPKLVFFIPETEDYIGSFSIVDINIHKDYVNSVTTPYNLVEFDDLKKLYKHRKRFSHKGTFGHCLCIGGSIGMTGALLLMSKAALKSGAGLVSALVNDTTLPIVQTALPEVICLNTHDSNFFEVGDSNLQKYQSVAIGPGFGTDKDKKEILSYCLSNVECPMVIDADAINILSCNREMLNKLPENSILTPHFKEFQRLVDVDITDSFMRINLIRDFCINHKVYMILKGAYSIVCTPQGDCYYNPTGNPGMATGGSGDVLTGVIAGLLAQGYNQRDACILATYLHGRAGDISALQNGYEAIIASDIIENLGNAFMEIY